MQFFEHENIYDRRGVEASALNAGAGTRELNGAGAAALDAGARAQGQNGAGAKLRCGIAAVVLAVALALASLPFNIAAPFNPFAPSASSASSTSSALFTTMLKPQVAYAETYTGGKILNNETEFERLTNSYLDMRAQLQEVEAQLQELAEEIPVQQEKSDYAIKVRYKNQSEPFALLDALFSAGSLDEFFKQAEYIERVSSANLAEVNRLKEMKAQADALKAKIDEEFTPVREAYEAELQRRAARQSSDVNSATSQARTLGGEASVGVAFDGGEQPEDYKEAATTDTSALADGADWHSDRDAFIEHWAERLNAYLAGSALDGQGENFAKAAWKYNIDPRWSAAISNTESSKGAICIRNHNAWGWGADDRDPVNLASEWDSWEEAIDGHAKGLSEGYGYTISIMGARAYCPNTWQSWYNKTLGEMARI